MKSSEAGKGDDNRSDSKAYRDNYQNVDRSTPPKAINPNKPMFKADGIINPSNELEGMKPVHGSAERAIITVNGPFDVSASHKGEALVLTVSDDTSEALR